MTPVRLRQGDARLADVLTLVRNGFAYMAGRIDPPSSMLQLDVEALAHQAETGEIWVLGDPVRACVFLTPKPGRLYLGKLTVAPDHRNLGLARAMVDHAADRARALNLQVLELQTRVELAENHVAFKRMGFVKTGETAHPGYDRATSITMQRRV